MPNYDEDINFQQGSDSGENDNASIQPVGGAENIWDVTINRPTQNLRRRDEIVRQNLADQKYFADYDRALIPTCLGVFTLTLVSAAPNKYSIIPDQDLIIYPALTPGYISGGRDSIITGHHGAKLISGGQPYVGTLPNELRIVASRDSTGQRNFSNGDSLATPGVLSVGANRISIELVPNAVPGGPGSITAVVTGVPARHIKITYGTAAPATTTNDIIAFINADAVSQGAYGLRHLIRAGTTLGTGAFTTALAPTQLQGSYDAEAFRVSVAQFVNFFATVDNQLRDGDGLAVAFPAGPVEFGAGNKGGRRQSIYDVPVDQVGGFTNNITPSVGDNLLNTAREPEKIPGSIPIGKLVGAEFIFTDGTRVPVGTPVGLGESATMYLRLASIVPGSSGALLVGYGGSPNWHPDSGPDVIGATTVEGAIDEIVTDLAGIGVGTSGTRHIGGEPITGFASPGNIPHNVISGSIRIQLLDLLNAAATGGIGGGVNTRVSEFGHALHGMNPVQKDLGETAPQNLSAGGAAMIRAIAPPPTPDMFTGAHKHAHADMLLVPMVYTAPDVLALENAIAVFSFASSAVSVPAVNLVTLEAIVRAASTLSDSVNFVESLVVKIKNLVPGPSLDGDGFYLVQFVDIPNSEVRLRRLDGTNPDFTGAGFGVAKITFYTTVLKGTNEEGTKYRAFHAAQGPMMVLGARNPGDKLVRIFDSANHPNPSTEVYPGRAVWEPAAATPRDTNNILGATDKDLLDGVEDAAPVDATASHHHGGTYTRHVFAAPPVFVPNLDGTTDLTTDPPAAGGTYNAGVAIPAGYTRIAVVMSLELWIRPTALLAPGALVRARIILDTSPPTGTDTGGIAYGVHTGGTGAGPQQVAIYNHVVVPCAANGNFVATLVAAESSNLDLTPGQCYLLARHVATIIART